MNEHSGGESPPYRSQQSQLNSSPSSSIANGDSGSSIFQKNINKKEHLLSALSPKAKNICQSIEKNQYFKIPDQQDFDSLNKELVVLEEIFREDTEMKNEINRLSQSLEKVKRKKFNYSMTDLGPFYVMVESQEGNVGNMHPMSIGKKLYKDKVVGKTGILRKGRNKIAVEFDNATNANNFVKTTSLRHSGFKVYIPQTLITCRGIIRDVCTEIEEEDIFNYAKVTLNLSFGRSHSPRIIDVKRINKRIINNVDGERNISIVPTTTIKVTFEGNRLPHEFSIFDVKRRIVQYVNRVIMCNKCLRYGHHKDQCRGSERCSFCAEQHESESCVLKDSTTEHKCIHCDGNHSAKFRDCPERIRQRDINELMAQNNISYFDANILLPHPKKKNTQSNSRNNVNSRFELSNNEFPLLENNIAVDNFIPNNQNTRKSFSQSVSNRPTERNTRPNRPMSQPSYRPQKRSTLSPNTPPFNNKIREFTFPSSCRTRFPSLISNDKEFRQEPISRKDQVPDLQIPTNSTNISQQSKLTNALQMVVQDQSNLKFLKYLGDLISEMIGGGEQEDCSLSDHTLIEIN